MAIKTDILYTGTPGDICEYLFHTLRISPTLDIIDQNRQLPDYMIIDTIRRAICKSQKYIQIYYLEADKTKTLWDVVVKHFRVVYE